MHLGAMVLIDVFAAAASSCRTALAVAVAVACKPAVASASFASRMLAAVAPTAAESSQVL